MAPSIELVVTDLDGTLWGTDHVVHEASRRAIGQLTSRGIDVLVATARRSGPVRRSLVRNDLSMPAVLLDGALVRDTAWRTVHADAFDVSTAAEVIAVFRRHDLEPCIGVLTDGDVDARLGPRPSTHPDHVAYLADWVVRCDLDDVVAGETVQSFSVCGMPAGLLDPVAEALAAIAAPLVTWDAVYGASTLTVGPAGVHKWRGVAAYCEHASIDARAVLAVGDGLNDVELLRGAAIACVIEGSHPQVMACADHVLGAPHVGGWAAVVDLVG